MKQIIKTPSGVEIVDVEQPEVEISKEIQIEELKQKLSDTDYVIIKIAEGSATKEEYTDIIEQRKVWRTKINRLEAETIE